MLVLQDWLERERPRIRAELFEWLRIPSVSADPDRRADVARSAEHLAGRFRAAGLEHVEVLDAGGSPAVYADWLHAGPGAPTAVVYGHHDVQPAEPLELWDTPPFEPTEVEGEIRARGAVDDKGQVAFQLEAARGLLEVEGRLPVNLRFLVEGEEEVGSPSFEALLETEAERLRCDVVVVSDTEMWSPEVPTTCIGMRGLVAFDVEIRTATTDLHSGLFGGAVPNPAHLLARMVADLHDTGGRVAIPGFYDDVAELSETERASLEALPLVEAEWQALAGVARLDGEAGRSVLERTGTRPTCDVVGIGVGYTGPGIKTIVPAAGGCKVTFRLVPHQRPEAVAAAFRAFVAERVPEGVEVTITPEGAVAPMVTPADSPEVAALGRAIEAVWGRAPLLTRIGGSGPEEALGRVLGAPVLFLGAGLPGDRIHAPNERFVVEQFERGLLAAAELWHELAATPR